MKSHTCLLRILFLLVALALPFLAGPSPAAQEPGRDLEDLAKRISKELSKARVSSVVVADFVTLSGNDSSEGHYLAEEFSQRLEHHKKNFAVTESKRVVAALASAKISTKDLNAPDILQRIGTLLQADVVVTGTLETVPDHYSVKVTARRAQDGSVVASADARVLVLLDPGGPATVARAGVDGVGVPNCVSCPPPLDTDTARAAKMPDKVGLLVVINEEGRVIRIVVTKANDDGLAKNAVETVRGWKFKPATDKDGKAVAVIVPIEVNFRLY
jgi:TonB family protein